MKHIMHAYQGQMLTADQLAALAGCSAQAIRKRLREMLPEQAVLLGESAKPKRFEHNGHWLTYSQLAALAGCSRDAMKDRVGRGRYTVEEAVNIGADGMAAHRAAVAARGDARLQQKAQARAEKAKPAPVRVYARIDAQAPVICNVKPVQVQHREDFRYTFVGAPGRHVDSSQCRPWAAAVGG